MRWQGALGENTPQHYREFVFVCVCGLMRRTRVLSVASKPWTFRGLQRVLVFWFKLQRPSRGGRSMEINNNHPTPSPWAQETQQDPSRTSEGVLSSFSGFCFLVLFAALLCFQPWLWEESRARCHLDPSENSVVKWARKYGREDQEGRRRSRRERGVKGAWRLPLICHKDGRHVMIANVEQIGLEGKRGETGKGGEETDGKAGLVPTIPRHDDAGKPPPAA